MIKGRRGKHYTTKKGINSTSLFQNYGGLSAVNVNNGHICLTRDRSTMAALYELCLQPSFSGPLHEYWCIVNNVFTHCGPQYIKFGFSRAPVRCVGAVPQTLTTDYRDKHWIDNQKIAVNNEVTDITSKTSVNRLDSGG